MNLLKKIEILSDSAKYDASCSSSGNKRNNSNKNIGSCNISGICHTWSSDGRCISLLKILLTNKCIFDCAYCINRSSNDIERASFTSSELAKLTINFYIRNYIEGLFLSSAIEKNPNYTMEILLNCVKLLRKKYKFNGYIHLKAIPGADEKLIKLAGNFVDRLSVNIELPSEKSLKLLAPQKSKLSILTPMKNIRNSIKETNYENKNSKNKKIFVPAGQSTQLIVGATKESDYKIIKLSENLYKKFKLKRVYYSAYIPVGNHTKLLTNLNPPLLREHRIYQADWLLRFYGFKANELLNDNIQNFDENIDPKSDWALRNLDKFPIELNNANLKDLLKIPGIGIISARKILTARKFGNLNFENLKTLNVSIKKAKFFVTVNGKFLGDLSMNKSFIKSKLSIKKNNMVLNNQISMFENFNY